jgi:hypothetical protein
MGKPVESHPDAQSRREMLEQMHRCAGQKLQPIADQNKAPRHTEQQASTPPKLREDSIP